MSIVVGSAVLGAAYTVAAGSEPGFALGACLIAGTLIAGFAVRADAVYLIIPVPALAYVVAGTVAGFIHDRAADASRTALVASAVQWAAGGFRVMAAATVLVIVLAAGRWLLLVQFRR